MTNRVEIGERSSVSDYLDKGFPIGRLKTIVLSA